MKYIFYITFCFLLYACSNSTIEKIESKHPNGKKDRVSYYQQVDGKEILVEQKFYYDNGVFKMGGKIINNKRSGEWVSYFNNKQVQSTGLFTEGIRVGDVKVYFPNGNLRYEGQYENNREIGLWKFYSEDGNFHHEVQY